MRREGQRSDAVTARAVSANHRPQSTNLRERPSTAVQNVGEYCTLTGTIKRVSPMPSNKSTGGTEHIKQSIPHEWRSVGIDDRTLIVRDVPEGTVECFVISTTTRNVRSFARADAVLYEGKVVEPYYDEDIRCVEFVHDFAGTVGRHSVTEWLEEPAVRLKRLPSADLTEVVA